MGHEGDGLVDRRQRDHARMAFNCLTREPDVDVVGPTNEGDGCRNAIRLHSLRERDIDICCRCIDEDVKPKTTSVQGHALRYRQKQHCVVGLDVSNTWDRHENTSFKPRCLGGTGRPIRSRH